MKTTIDLPDSLVQEVKLRALRDGRKLKDTIADLLQRGLASSDANSFEDSPAYLGRDERSGLPLIRCQRRAQSHQQLTPERAATVLLEQDVEWHDGSARH